MKSLGPIFAVLSTVFFWGSSFPVMSFLLETVTPMILATGRFSLAAFYLCYGVCIIIKRE